MKVLLIQPPHVFEGGSRTPDTFPLNLAYLGRAAEDAGHRVEVLNIWQHQWNEAQVVDELKPRDFDVCGITALSTQYKYVKWLCKAVKEVADVKIFVGGALATFNSSLVLDKTMADYCVVGEGERKFVELLDKPFAPVKACYEGEYVSDIDTIGFPAWHLFDLDFYLRPVHFYGARKGYRSMNVVTSRGCPYKCRFCSRVFSGVRLRSIANIVSEIKELISKYGVECVKFDDDLVMVSKKRMMDLCDALEPLGIHFVCQGRTNIVDYEMLERMKKTGCMAVGYGVESGSQTILKNMDKRTTVEQSKNALLNTLNVGIYPIVQMMFGYPGETEATLQETVDFFKDVPFLGDKVYLATTTALPGSELYEQCLKEGRIPNEEQYLESLAGGYLRFGGKMLINFTNLRDEQFDEIKEKTERAIFHTQILHHPLSFIRTVVAKLFWKLIRTIPG